MPTAYVTTVPSPKKLSGIEALRGIAATAVVFSHAARHVDKAFGAPGLITAFQAGHAGVDLFFVLSGFIILFVHRRDIGQPGRLQHYMGRRFNRVMPLYWLVLALTIGMSVAGRHDAPSLLWLFWSAALLPSLSEPLLGIAWTLQFEVVFYAVFAMLIVSRGVGLALLAVWFVWIVSVALGFDSTGVPGSLCGIYGLEFFMGMGAAQLLNQGRVPAPLLLAAAGLALFAITMVLESGGVLNGFGNTARLTYGLPAALLVLGVAAAEQAGQLRVPSWLRTLGGASYSIYLFQFVFIGIVWQGWLKIGLDHYASNLTCFLVLASSALAGGILAARLVEQPMLQLMRRRQALAPQQA
jgi:exopolysaccharide production protein ExoZ